MTKKKKEYTDEELKKLYGKAIPPSERKVRVGKRVVKLSEQIWRDIGEKKKRKEREERIRKVGRVSRSMFRGDVLVWIIVMIPIFMVGGFIISSGLINGGSNFGKEPTFIQWMDEQGIYDKCMSRGQIIPPGFYDITVQARYAAAEEYTLEVKEGNNLYEISPPGQFYMADAFVLYYDGRLSTKVYQNVRTMDYYVFCEDGADGDYNDLILKIRKTG